jgi:dGTPase
MAMDWKMLLSSKRLGKQDSGDKTVGRSEFQRDFDRIVFSSAFRRLQDKTQVVPLPKSDYVRTRLTHSLEASCVGRSLGRAVGSALQEMSALPNDISPVDFGDIVAAACLAHDIGNPPFGHAGELAFQQWFSDHAQPVLAGLDTAQKLDFEKFEGNAQGFRVITQLQNPHNPGLQLTCVTLATAVKYPRESYILDQDAARDRASTKKHGYFQSEKGSFDQVAQEVGLIKKHSSYSWWCRHPLAFLVEAADDIAYRIIDFEDGCRLKHITFDEAKPLLESIIGETATATKLSQIEREEDKIGYLRAKSINSLVFQAKDVFKQYLEGILAGEFDEPLIHKVKTSVTLANIQQLSVDRYYKSREVLEIEVPGFRVLWELLEAFISAVDDVALSVKPKPKSTTVIKLIPSQFLTDNGRPDRDKYKRLLQITDFVSGMTDSYAVAIYKQITGISLPR